MTEPLDVPGAPSRRRSRGTVLFVDDEAVLRNVAVVALSRTGFEVLLGDDVPAAVDLLNAHLDALSLVVVDWSLPSGTALDLLAVIRSRRPGLAIIVSSGVAESNVRARVPPGTNLRVLTKPWTMRALVDMVEAAVDRTA